MQITGVFEVLAEIEEIGAWVGDRIVVRPWAFRPGLLQRTIAPHWAFDERCGFVCTEPVLPTAIALRHLITNLPRLPRRCHLEILE